MLFLVRGDAHVTVTTNGNFTILARFYESAVSAKFVEEWIHVSVEKVVGDEIIFLGYQTRPIHFIVIKLELLHVKNGFERSQSVA